jgi:uncharacterized protein with von Willebrand factor type A (vWA) domain
MKACSENEIFHCLVFFNILTFLNLLQQYLSFSNSKKNTMKKLLVLVALLTTVYVSQVNAQQNGDPAARAQQWKERVKPQLVEKVKLTDAQAEKVMEINLNARSQMRGMRDMSEDDRKKKMEEVNAGLVKEYKAIPLTDDQVKAVTDFFEEQRKQMMQQRQQGNGGN